MMKWWELLPTRYTSNMLFRPWGRVKKPVGECAGQGLEPEWRSRGCWRMGQEQRLVVQWGRHGPRRVFLPHLFESCPSLG